MKKIVVCALLLSILLGVQIASAAMDYWFNDRHGTPILYATLPDSWKGEWQDYDGMYFLNAIPRDESLVVMWWALYDVRG